MNRARIFMKSNRRRSGAALIESAVVLSVMLLVLFGVLDLGLAALHSNNLTDVAQQLTRAAVVRGKNATALTAWGPATYHGTGASAGEIGTLTAASLQIIKKEKVSITVEWLDGGNDDGDRVRTTLNYLHPFIVPQLFGFSSCQLKAVSTMRVSH